MSYEAYSEERLWRAEAGSIARRVNLGWWWHRLAPALVGVNLAGAGTLLLFRQQRWPLLPCAFLLAGAWLAAAVWAWWRARARFYAVPEGLLRLETHLGWHNVLSAAAAGGVRWPNFPEEALKPVQWQWGPSARPLLASLAFLLAGLFVPVGAPPKPYLPPPAQLPIAVQQVQTWTETLKEQKLVEPAMLETWDQRLQQLKKKPAQEWYGQEGLEAAESLRNQMSQEIDTTGKSLKKAADMLSELQSMPAGASVPAEFNSALNQQLANMQNGGLPMKQDVAQAISNAQNLSPKDLDALKKQLQDAAKTMSSMQSGNAPPCWYPRFWDPSVARSWKWKSYRPELDRSGFCSLRLPRFWLLRL